MSKNEKNVIKLVACAPPKCSCPKIELDFDECSVYLYDDFGGYCHMTFTEFENLSRRFLEYV